MANQGNLFLDNSKVISLYDETHTYESTVLDALYSEYKTTYKLSLSAHLRGKAADAFKNYLSDGAINIMCGFMDLTSDLTMISQMLAEGFFQYESTHNGRVEEKTLDDIKDELANYSRTLNSFAGELDDAIGQAGKYIATVSLNLPDVFDRYTDTRNTIDKIASDLSDVDQEATKAVIEVYERILSLKNMIANIKGHCYSGDGKIRSYQLSTLTSQSWYGTCGNVTLFLLLQEDPFSYAAGDVTVSEDQWAIGLCSDVYAYAGYSFLAASGEAGIEDNTAFAKGKASVLRANGYAQFTDYLHGEANVKVAYAEGDAKIGFSDKYAGFKVSGEVGLIKADGSVVLGSENLNAFIKGEAKVLCADGKAAFEFEEDGQFAVGVDASATLASASVKGGTTILGYKNKDLATGETETLLGFKVGAKADAGGSFAVWAESKTAFETDFVNVNATTLKIDAALLLGLDLSVTIPTIYPKWPW